MMMMMVMSYECMDGKVMNCIIILLSHKRSISALAFVLPRQAKEISRLTKTVVHHHLYSLLTPIVP